MASAGSSGGASEDPPEPEGEEPSELAPGPDDSIASQCLVGLWRVNHESFAGYMEDAFETPAQSEVEFRFQTGRGDLFLEFSPDGVMSMSGQDFQIDMEIVGLASFTFFLQAEGSASYTANSEAIAVYNYDYESTAEGGGQVLTMPEVGAEATLTLTPDSLFLSAQSENLSRTIEGVPDESSASEYQCSGDTLVLGPADFQPVLWERVN